LGSLLDFISQETNIPVTQLLLYEYDAIFLENLIRRNDFELIPIPKQCLSKTFSDYTNNFKKNFLFLYINTLDSYKILKEKVTCEEYYLNNKLDKPIHVSKELNMYTFNQSNMAIDSEIFLTDHVKILFIKEYNRALKCFEIKNIQCINFEYYRVNFIIFIEYLQTLIGYRCESFYVESSCLLNNKDSEEAIKPVVITQYNINSLFLKSNAIILIPENVDDLFSKIETLTSEIFVDMFLFNKQIFLLNKLKINFKTCSDETLLKKSILDKIVEGNLFQKIFHTDNNYYLDFKKNFTPADFINKSSFTTDYIDLLPDRDSNQRYHSIYKDYPVFKYLNFNDMRIDFNLNLYPKQISPDVNFEEIAVYDKDNNKLYTISSILARRCKKAKECIDYIYEVALANSELNAAVYDKRNYYFILQHPKIPYIYQLLIDNNCELFTYEGKADIQYRLQPFSDDEIELFGNNNYFKLFIFFQTNSSHIYLDPIVLYVNRNEKLKDVKTMILDKMIRMNSILGLFENNILEDLENLLAIISSCLSFYQVRIHECKIKKEFNLHNKDIDTMENIYRDMRVYNLLVEINKI
jgi:hypothetical protein